MRAAEVRGRTADASSVAPSAATGCVLVLGVPFAALSYGQALERMRRMIVDGGAHQVVLANAHTLNLAWDDPAYHRLLCDASLVLRDGVGIEIGSLLKGRHLGHNFVGTDFVPRLLGSLSDLAPRVFLYGAAPGVAARAAEVLRVRCPHVHVTGFEHGYGDPEAAAARIRTVGADVLLVALGNPRQEVWIAEHLGDLGVRVAIGVGALFDFLSGRVQRAPAWMVRIRGEWLFRLCLEPSRLWRRYMLGNPLFLWRVTTSRRELT